MDVTTALQQTRQHFRRLDLTLPPALLKELDEVDAVLSKRTTAGISSDTLVTSAWNALAAGRDLVADKAVTGALMAGMLAQQNLGFRLGEYADRLRAEAFTRHAEDVLNEMAGIVTSADETLAAAHAVITDLDLTSPSAVTAIAPKYASVWAHAREAAIRLDSVGQVWVYVVAACRLAPIPHDQRGRSLIFLDVDLDELDALPLVPHSPASWTTAVAHSGHRLDYAMPQEVTERCRRIEQQRAELAQRAEEKQKAGFSR
ncbi:hypothetical protein [Rhodococcus sp. USK13]|uniref:hypothetical protein n=1 Tax=Rhodococcus sp. USK13 TaxID=2806442 RepID=UPI001BCFF09C|nr:hypothetical protein [Rhodococcus sp. USK13]